MNRRDTEAAKKIGEESSSRGERGERRKNE
jgi:hypothetical protein